MAVTANVTRQSLAPGGSSILKTITVSADIVESISITVGPSVTNQLWEVSWNTGNLTACWLNVDGTLTLKQNSSSSPAGTITLIPNQPLDWYTSDGYFTNPWNSGGTITAAYLSNATSATVTLRGFLARSSN